MSRIWIKERCCSGLVPFLFLIVLGQWLLSCGTLPKEGPSKVQVSLSLSDSSLRRSLRAGTQNNRLTEYVVAVETAVDFSPNGPAPELIEDANLVTLVDNSVRLNLPVATPLKLFIFRYDAVHEKAALDELKNQELLGTGSVTLGIGAAIDFGQSNDFEIAIGDQQKTLTVQLTPDLTGKLAQTYVQGATIWADRLEVGSNTGNFQLDADEVSAISEADGSYILFPPSYHDFLLVTDNGKKQDASGQLVAAAPMLAPLPGFGQNSVNITPLTTLVATEPSLKDYLDTLGGWNVDVADPEGVPGGLLKISLLAEAYSVMISGGSSPLIEGNLTEKFRATAKLADAIFLASTSSSEVVLDNVITDGFQNLMADPAISHSLTNDEKTQFESALRSMVAEIEKIPADTLVKESDVLFQIETSQQQAFNQLKGIVCGETAAYLNFTPVIKSISMHFGDGALRLVGLVDDDNYSVLGFTWLDEAGNELKNSSSTSCETAEATYPGFSPDKSHSFTLTVNDPGIDNVVATCSWAVGATFTECQF